MSHLAKLNADAQRLLTDGQFEAARRVFERIAQQFPASPYGPAGLASVAARLGDWPLALSLWAQARERFPKNLGIQIGYANALKHTGDLDAAESVLDDLIGRQPPTVRPYLLQAAIAHQRAQHERALRIARAAVQYFPDEIAAHAAVARALLLVERYAEALLEVAEIRRRFPEDRSVCLIAATAQERQFAYRAAAQTLQTALDRWPDDAALKIRLGQIHLNTGQALKALEVLDSLDARELASMRRVFDETYLRALSQSGAMDRMQTYLAQRMQELPVNPALFAWSASAVARTGEATAAIETLDAFLAAPPADAETLGHQLHCDAVRARYIGVRCLRSARDLGELEANCSEAPAESFERIHAFCMRLAAGQSYAAQLEQVHASLTALADHFAENCLSASVSPLAAYRVLAKILAHIRHKKALSLLRLGDGEGNFLDYPERFAAFQAGDRSSVQKLWWGCAPIDAEAWEQLRPAYHAAIGNADVLGVPDLSWRFRINAPDFLRSGEIITAQRGILAAVETLPTLDFAQDGGGELAQQRILTTAHIGHDLEFWGLYRLLLTASGGCSLVTCHAELPETIAQRFSVEVDQVYEIPGEYRWREMLGHESGSGPSHFPERFEQLRAELQVKSDGELFLVAAGFLGKFYCDAIKRRGGIAIDVGSIVDYWLGFDTRGAEHYDGFAMDLSGLFRRLLAAS